MSGWKDVAKIAGGVWVGNKLSQPKREKTHEETILGCNEVLGDELEKDTGSTGVVIVRIIGAIVGITFGWSAGSTAGYSIVGAIIMGTICAMFAPIMLMAAFIGLLVSAVLFL